MQHSRIPVLGHGEGICHVYVDRAADCTKRSTSPTTRRCSIPPFATRRRHLLVHEAIAAEFLPRMVAKLKERGGRNSRRFENDRAPAGRKHRARHRKRLGDRIFRSDSLRSKLSANLDEAIDHINRYGSRHTDAIVTEDSEAAREIHERSGRGGRFSERLHALRGRLPLRAWRRTRHQQQQTARARPHGPRRPHHLQIQALWRWPHGRSVCTRAKRNSSTAAWTTRSSPYFLLRNDPH